MAPPSRAATPKIAVVITPPRDTNRLAQLKGSPASQFDSKCAALEEALHHDSRCQPRTQQKDSHASISHLKGGADAKSARRAPERKFGAYVSPYK